MSTEENNRWERRRALLGFLEIAGHALQSARALMREGDDDPSLDLNKPDDIVLNSIYNAQVAVRAAEEAAPRLNE